MYIKSMGGGGEILSVYVKLVKNVHYKNLIIYGPSNS